MAVVSLLHSMKHKPEASGIPIYCAFSEVKPAKELKPNPRNPRRHPAQQLDRYEAAIKGNGWRRAVVVSERSGLIGEPAPRGHFDLTRVLSRAEWAATFAKSLSASRPPARSIGGMA